MIHTHPEDSKHYRRSDAKRARRLADKARKEQRAAKYAAQGRAEHVA